MLNECHKSEVIRYKLEGPLSKVRIQKPSEKAFVLLQANIGQHSFENYTLKHEMTSMVANAQRILAAAQEYSIKGSENGHVALQCLKLRRSLNASLWDKSSGVLNQIPDIGQQCTAKMKFNGIVSFQQAMDASEVKIERASGRTSPFGKQVRSLVSRLLSENLKVAAEIEYTRGSNIAAGVLCRLQRFKPVLASSDKKNMTVTYTLVSVIVRDPLKQGIAVLSYSIFWERLPTQTAQVLAYSFGKELQVLHHITSLVRQSSVSCSSTL